MPALADLPEIVGFFSYAREDDNDSDGALSLLRRRIQSELRGLLARDEKTLRLWQDSEAIPPGVLWESQISTAIDQAVFFIPIITPRVVRSRYCNTEFAKFLDRERGLQRSDLVFPIVYIEVPQLKDERQWRDHPVLDAIGRRQYVNWCDFRFDMERPEVRRAIAAFCRRIRDALEREVAIRRAPEPPPPPPIPDQPPPIRDETPPPPLKRNKDQPAELQPSIGNETPPAPLKRDKPPSMEHSAKILLWIVVAACFLLPLLAIMIGISIFG